MTVLGPTGPDDVLPHTPIPWTFENPPGWRRVVTTNDGAQWRLPGGRIVIASVSVDGEDRKWLHLSQSHKSRLPSWPELVEMRDAIAGEDAEAYQVIPPKERYVNIHSRVLHLWIPLDGPVLPRFDGIVGGLNTI